MLAANDLVDGLDAARRADRHGVHLPQDSTAQNSIAKRACFAMSTLSSNTMPPWPISPSRAAKAS